MTSSFSVTKVRVAFECPRLFYLGHRFGGSVMFLPKGNLPNVGTQFHSLADRLMFLAKQEPRFQELFVPNAGDLQVEAIAQQMQNLFYELEFYPLLQKVAQAKGNKAQSLYQVWQGLIGLIRRWAELLVNNRQYCAADEVIPKTLLDLKPSVKHEFLLPNGAKQLVQGRFDSLIYDFAQHRLCVVEYKTYQSPDKSAQLAQVALYSYMLREKIGVPIDSAVYSVLPDWQELTFSWDELENTVHQLIPQKLQQMQSWIAWEPPNPNPPPPTTQVDLLCNICPQRQMCQTFFDGKDAKDVKDKVVKPNNIAHKEEKTIDISSDVIPKKESEAFTTPSQPEVDKIGKDLVNALQSFGVGVEYQGAAIAPAFIRVKLKPDPGVRIAAILRSSNDLRVQLGLEHPPLIAPQTGYVSVDLPRRDRAIAQFAQYIQPVSSQTPLPARIAIGVNLEGQLIEANLSDPNTCHFLVGGTTGSGKSEFLRSLLLSLLARHSPQHLQIALVDPKRVTFPEFEQMPWLYAPVVKDSDRAIALMTELVGEMEQRYHLFERAKCADIQSYNKKLEEKDGQFLSRIVCIFDEYADFMAEKEIRIELEQSIKRLGAMARAAGIHLIVATQRPEAKVVTPLIRSNLPGRVALRTASEADSAIILGSKETSAANLLGKGDLLFQSGSQLLRLQSLFADVSDFTVIA
jgi:DNA segregation ATPase FtsK/SpoIIIE, S-DNA-T family